MNGSLEDVMPKITSRCRRQVKAAFTRWQDGKLSTSELQQLLVSLLAGANEQGRMAAEALATILLQRAGIATDIGGLRHIAATGEGDRLDKAVATVLADLDTDSDVAARLARMAGSEPAQAGQDYLVLAYQDADADGWQRQLEADACDLCRDWAAGDPVFPMGTTMLHHPGCQCTPIPTTKG